MPDLRFAKGPNPARKRAKREPNSKTKGQKRANHFFQIYQQLQSHTNPYLAIYLIAVFLNHNCSSTAKQVHDKKS